MNSTTNTSIHAHNEQASAHRQEGTPMNTNDLYALFDNMPHPRQVTPDTYGGYMCEPSPENHCVMLLDIDYGAMGGASLYVSEPGVLDTRIEFTADSPAMSAANLDEWLACFDRMRADLRNAYVWASTLLSTAGRGQA